jgi:hypothetical protein|tara:strand:+ start:418 stop:651 length:234 start_codon:yes stop_codon:yes gene_type:complete
MTDDRQEALHMDLCDLCEKYSDTHAAVFANIVTGFIADFCLTAASSEHLGISIMLQAIAEKGIAYERKEDDRRNTNV